MLEQAINKVQAEMDSSPESRDIQAIGSFLLSYLRSKPEHAENILDPGKTLQKSFAHMRDVAMQKYRQGNTAWLSDEEGFEIVLQYFDIASSGTVKPIPKSSFDVRLEDLL